MVIRKLTRVGNWVHGNSVSSLKLYCKSKIVSKSSLLKEISTALKTVFSDIERKSCNNSQQKPLSLQKESSDSAVEPAAAGPGGGARTCSDTPEAQTDALVHRLRLMPVGGELALSQCNPFSVEQ